MLCTLCQNKTTIQTPGQCTACSGPTTHFAYRLCSPCSVSLDECEWCQAPLNPVQGTVVVVQGPTAYYVTLRQGDDGGQVNGMKVGEEIHIILDEDQYTWIEWDVKTYNRGRFRLKTRGQFVANPNDPQYGEREFVFEVVGSGTGDIEFHEVQRTWSWGWGSSTGTSTPVAGGKTWKSDFQVV